MTVAPSSFAAPDANAPPRLELTTAQRTTLAALSTSILDGAPFASFAADVVDEFARKLALAPHDRQRAALRAIEALGSPVAVFMGIRRWQRFEKLDGAQRTACLAAWGRSQLPQLRTAFQLVRRLFLASHYARPDVLQAIGYAGAFHARAVKLPWEGALVATQESTSHDALSRAASPAPESLRNSQLAQREGTIIDCRTRTSNASISVDAIVVGSGAGGAVAAARLAEHGWSVAVLEEGSWMSDTDFSEQEAPMVEQLYADGGTRATDDLSVSMLQGTTAGGSSTINWMIMLRTPDHVLDEWAQRHGAEGMSPSEMRTVFDRIEQDVHAAPVPHDAHSMNNRLLLDSAQSLGWRVDAAIINAHNCRRCGFCGVGCRYGAKQSVLTTYLPRALRAGATIYTHARATRIEVIERDTGRGIAPLKRVTVSARGGAQRSFESPIVMLAGGGIGTPVLLQRSGMGGDAVGRFLRLHPTTIVTGEHDRVIAPGSGIPLTASCSEFTAWRGSHYGFWIQCPPVHPMLGAAATSGFGREHAARMMQLERTSVFIALTRDGADLNRSSGDVRARRGGVSIRYRLADADASTVRASIRAAAELHLAAGANIVRTAHTEPIAIRSRADLAALDHAATGPNQLGLFSAHVNGTCRLGTLRSTSGATPDGERHGVRGVYIVDGSLLPTAPGVNPQETIMALSSVISDRVLHRHGANAGA